jgi:outer membrane immunogenic protein
MKMDAFASIRGRMGLAYDNVLAYVTAGPAFGHFKSSVDMCTTPNCTAAAGSPDRATATNHTWLPGIATGAGVEFMATNNLLIRGEFLYLLFRDNNTDYIVRATGVPVSCTGGVACGINFANSAVVARLGASWKFN